MQFISLDLDFSQHGGIKLLSVSTGMWESKTDRSSSKAGEIQDQVSAFGR
jgi:hypothetical protein